MNSMPLSAPYRSLNELQRAGQPLVSTLFAFSATPAGPGGTEKGGMMKEPNSCTVSVLLAAVARGRCAPEGARGGCLIGDS